MRQLNNFGVGNMGIDKIIDADVVSPVSIQRIYPLYWITKISDQNMVYAELLVYVISIVTRIVVEPQKIIDYLGLVLVVVRPIRDHRAYRAILKKCCE